MSATAFNRARRMKAAREAAKPTDAEDETLTVIATVLDLFKSKQEETETAASEAGEEEAKAELAEFTTDDLAAMFGTEPIEENIEPPFVKGSLDEWTSPVTQAKKKGRPAKSK